MKAGNEFEGKTVDQAVEKAAETLHTEPKKIKYDVITIGSTGIFGLVGVKKAKIRVISPATPDLSGDGGGNDSAGRSKPKDTAGVVQSLVDEAFNGYSSKKETQQPPPAPKSKKETQPPPTPEPKKDEPVAERPAEKRQPRGEDLLSLACVDLGKVALEKIVAAITIDTDVTVEQIQDRVLYRVSGGNPSVLIGKRGQNLEAIQYLIDKIVNKTNERRIRVQVDAAGYLEKRKENLIRLAERMAEKTHKTGKPSTVGPMNAQDRRVVHITLKNDKGVRTQSVGDGYYRKLMIFPKKSTAPRKKKYGETVVADNSRA